MDSRAELLKKKDFGERFIKTDILAEIGMLIFAGHGKQ